MLPQRRTQGLLIEEMAEETVVYDTKRHEAHCLNRAAHLVWQHCDGQTTEAALAQLLRDELSMPADEPMVRLMLEQLHNLHLLEEHAARPAVAMRRSRREVARQLAILGLSGMVLTIASPPAYAAASCIGRSCSTQNPCCSGTTCVNPPGGGSNKVCQPSV